MLILYFCALWIYVETAVAEALNREDQNEVQIDHPKNGLQARNVLSTLRKRDAGILQVAVSSDGG